MPRLPNALIYLEAFILPTRLKPDLRIPSISWVDWRAVRRDGWDAVVIDKDNCLTWPHRDTLHPSITKGWAEMKAAFGPGNVLVVSNSAGTRKDVGGIAVCRRVLLRAELMDSGSFFSLVLRSSLCVTRLSGYPSFKIANHPRPSGPQAESVSRALGVPVLLHAHPKPGCTPEITSYFSGHAPIHVVGRPPRIGELAEGWEVVEGVDIDEAGIIEEGDGRETLLGRRATRTVVPAAVRTHQPPIEPPTPYRTPLANPRLLVIGDRLATDVLLARRLAKYYRHTLATPTVLSIVTTSLFQKSDVRILRWMEESWLRLGLALSARLTRKRNPAEYKATMQRWILPHSVDSPPPVPTAVKSNTAPTASLRARIQSYFSGPAWRAWLLAQIPSRQGVLRAVKSGLGRGASGVIGMVRRLLVRRVKSA